VIKPHAITNEVKVNPSKKILKTFKPILFYKYIFNFIKNYINNKI